MNKVSKSIGFALLENRALTKKNGRDDEMKPWPNLFRDDHSQTKVQSRKTLKWVSVLAEIFCEKESFQISFKGIHWHGLSKI